MLGYPLELEKQLVRMREEAAPRRTDVQKAKEDAESAFAVLRDLGCDQIQGYLFGRPLSYERANQMVLGLGARRKAG